jgi:hypothetical protein
VYNAAGANGENFHLSGKPLGAFTDPTIVVLTADAMDFNVNVSNPNLDAVGGANSVTADVVGPGASANLLATRLVSTYFNTSQHAKGIIASYLDGHVTYIDTSNATNMQTLVTDINNGHVSGESYMDNYLTTTTSIAGTIVVPRNSLVAGAWVNNGSGSETFYSTSSTASAGTISFPAIGGWGWIGSQSWNLPDVDISAFGGPAGSPYTYGCQTATTWGSPITATLNLNLAAGTAADVYVSWGGFCANSYAGGTLTVTDVTNNVTFNGTTNSALTFVLPYNNNDQPEPSYVSEFVIGDSCKQLTIAVTDT